MNSVIDFLGDPLHADPPPEGVTERFLQHARRPACNQPLDQPSGRARGVGSCGDAITVFLRVRDDRITAIGLVPEGCIYTVVCASALGVLARGRSLEAALKITPEDVAAELDGLPPDHLHCAALAVNTMGEAIDDHYQRIWGRPSADEAPAAAGEDADHHGNLRSA